MVQANVEELRKLLDENKLFVGTDRTLKALREGKLEKVFVSSNAPADVRLEIAQLAKVGGVDVVELDENNDELGVLCRKPFAISVCGA